MKPLHTDDAITFRFNELSSVVELTASLDEHRGPGESNGCRVGVSTEAVKHTPVSRVGHEDRSALRVSWMNVKSYATSLIDSDIQFTSLDRS